MSLRIIFAGTPSFALAPLTALLASDHEIVAVYSQPDRPAGRGRKLTASPVTAFARAEDIPVFQPLSFRDADTIKALEALKPDLMIVVAYGLLLPQSVLDIPRYGCINIHASLLPRWRGAAPIQYALLSGDQETGITLMQMDAGLDTGAILRQASCPIEAKETAQTLHDKLSALGGDLLQATLPQIEARTLTPVPQAASKATLAPKLTKAQARADWSEAAVLLDRKIRAFNPWPVVTLPWGDGVLRVWEAMPIADIDPQLVADQQPGDVIQHGRAGVDVLTGEGVIRLLQVQRPGGRVMPAIDFFNANR